MNDMINPSVKRLLEMHGSRSWRGLTFAIVVLGFCTIPASGPVIAEEKDDEQAVMQAVMGFYGALANFFKGDTSAMVGAWSHADDVTYMGPDGGYLVGWEQVLENWHEQAKLQMGGNGGEVTPKNIRISVGQEIAVVHNLEEGRADVDGQPAAVSLRATNLFRKENGTWKQIGHHADLLPPLVKAVEGGG